MDSETISSLLLNNTVLRNKFTGVIPCDYLPQFPLLPAMFVVNTQDSIQPGLHWIAINCPSDGGPIEVFDSFGAKPDNAHVLRFLNMYAHSKYNTIQLQNPFSNSCGLFACLFLYFRGKGVSFDKFLGLFSNDLALNEKIAKEKFEKYILKQQKDKKKKKKDRSKKSFFGYGFFNNKRALYNVSCNQICKCLAVNQ